VITNKPIAMLAKAVGRVMLKLANIIKQTNVDCVIVV
jgi:hypothetical protein